MRGSRSAPPRRQEGRRTRRRRPRSRSTQGRRGWGFQINQPRSSLVLPSFVTPPTTRIPSPPLVLRSTPQRLLLLPAAPQLWLRQRHRTPQRPDLPHLTLRLPSTLSRIPTTTEDDAWPRPAPRVQCTAVHSPCTSPLVVHARVDAGSYYAHAAAR
jgi:hypothetical protein